MPSRLTAILTGLLLLALASVSNAASPALHAIAERLQPAPVLRGEFSQERTLEGFSRPLRSQGRFVAAREYGVLWYAQTPFPSLTVITEQRVSERVDGSEAYVLDSSQEPALAQVNRILIALLRGDLAALGEHFSITGDIDADGWQLRLQAQGELGAWLAVIELQGNTQVQQVLLHERGGDRTRIEFLALVRGEDLLPAEIAAFE